MYVRMAGSKAGQLGVDVCLESLESLGVPHCPHGKIVFFNQMQYKYPVMFYLEND